MRHTQFIGVIILAALLQPISGFAGVIEISGLVSYSETNLGEGASSRQNRYTGEFAWRFTRVSAVELSYSQSHTKISQKVDLNSVLFPKITQDSTYNDEVYSASWIQNLVPATFILQPYLKFGGGKLVRRQKVEYSAVFTSQEVSQKSITGVAGFGARLFLTKNMALKGEFVTYVPKFRFSQWKDSKTFSAGLSWMF